ncbi:hypothetical protein AVEN_60498-1 [Araneus ventricosus]|uniref:Uncharacterized protein n=1 Tax=Araneus ventricosus TaxID=182803 RepID=A0A4Y2G942_ARAVE|nr:hypothetical protein AVEN_60498-1 [Araneus ventricosus]
MIKIGSAARNWVTSLVVLSVSQKNCRHQIVQFTAVDIETGYRRKNPFLVGRSSFKCVPPKTDDKNKKLRLPLDSLYSKWIFPSITSCYRDRRKLDNLAATVSWRTDSSPNRYSSDTIHD